MKCVLAGSRYFGATVLEALRREEGVEFVCVIVPAADDRLALAAQAAGLPVHVLANPKLVPGEAIPDGTDLIVAAHTHARVSTEALARSRLGGIGYHPSLLPRHRGIAAVEWTILEGDPIAGGSVYHLADGWDAGAIAAQDWCFVARGESARELWERALAPMGLELLGRVVRHARDHGTLPAKHAGRPLRDARADDPARRRADRGCAGDDDVARRHGDGPRPARHRQPAVRPGPALRRELGGEPHVAAGRRVRRHGALRGAARERRCARRRRCAGSSRRA